ncbi:hypothetical protein RI129_005362 [Pyrocoelia pectoralis]|uniref:Major facilitator superfamily (MFS) profile domain-containing protein n=1 Tax=Pyrocoelia pectoralis TaxID=417401 RepID=A0AAN7ZS89_9COLE
MIPASSPKSSFKMKVRRAMPQILAVMVKNCLMLSFGMNLGYSTVLIGGVPQKSSGEFGNVSENQVSWLGSTTLLTILIGSLFSGLATQPLGRKRSMQLITIPFIICWIIFHYASQMWHLYFALAIMGIFGGLVEAPFSAYVSEITQPYLRGILSITGSLSALIGILIQFILGTFQPWRTCALISCAFPILTFILFCFVPESPYWLLLNGKVEEAKMNLAWLRGWTTIEDIGYEIDEMAKRYVKDDFTVKKSKFESYRHFLKKSFIWPFGLATFMFALANFTGASTLQTYAISIFATLRVPIDTYYATILLGLSQLVASLIGAALIHVIGKRLLLFISLVGICICNVLLATYAYVIDAKYIILVSDNTTEQNLGTDVYTWVPLMLLISLTCIDHIGNNLIPWVIIGEIFSYETRLSACGFASSASYLLNFLSNNMFLRIVSTITIPGMYYLYGGISFVGVIVLYFALPETEGKTLEEIADHFHGVSKLDNKVRRNTKDISKACGNDNPSFSNDSRIAFEDESVSHL